MKPLWRVCGLSAVALACGVPLALAQGQPPGQAPWSSKAVVSHHALVPEPAPPLAKGCSTHCHRLAHIWQRLLAALPWPPAGISPRLHVSRSPQVQAHATPGGIVVVSEAFIDERGLDDAQLAFVLAHELGHAVLEHERRVLTEALRWMPNDAPRTVADVYAELAVDFNLHRRLEPAYQETELEADRFGMVLAAVAGYDPALQLGFIAMERAQGTPQSLLRTHPDAQTRWAQASALARELALWWTPQRPTSDR